MYILNISVKVSGQSLPCSNQFEGMYVIEDRMYEYLLEIY